MQPSLTKHGAFTDFLFVLKKENKGMEFIEKKRSGVYTDLNLTTSETAQVIREAHILTLEQE